MATISLINPGRRKKARKTRAKRRKHVARRRSTKRRRRSAVVVVGRKINPRRGRKTSARRRHRARSRNPRLMGLSLSGITRQLVPAAIGGVGAIGLDIALSYLQPHLPASLQTGYLKTGVKIAGAIGLGMVAGKVLGGEKGRAVTMGALTVVLYGAIRDAVKQMAPTLNLGAVDYADNTVGAYMAPQVGYVNPAPFIQNENVGAYMSDGM